MDNRRYQEVSCLRAMVVLSALLALPALASSHREAPAISNDPAADNTDVWAWLSADRSTLNVVASYIPLEEPSGGPNFYKFSDDVLYQIHLVRGPRSLEDVVTYNFRFHSAPIVRADTASPNFAKMTGLTGQGGREFFAQISGYFNQTMDVTRLDARAGDTTSEGEDDPSATKIATAVPVAPPNIGPKTQGVLNALGAASRSTYDDLFASSFVRPTREGGQVFAGPRDDGFYVDLGAVFDLANNEPGSGGFATRTKPADGLFHFNTHSIVIEIPTASLTANGAPPPAGAGDANTIGVWASASRHKVSILNRDGSSTSVGPWTQVSRLGLPLINEAVIGIQDKDKFNRSRPADDLVNFGAYFLNPIIVKDAEAVGIYAALGVPASVQASLETNRVDIIKAINLTNFPAPNAHNLGTIGDVLRVDLGIASQFPNGRMVGGGANPNQDQANVTDVLLSLLLTGQTSGVTQGVNHNDADFLTDIPYLALPWDGYAHGHGQ